jgi:hypothetical protein
MSDLNLWPIDPIADAEYRSRTEAVVIARRRGLL